MRIFADSRDISRSSGAFLLRVSGRSLQAPDEPPEGDTSCLSDRTNRLEKINKDSLMVSENVSLSSLTLFHIYIDHA